MKRKTPPLAAYIFFRHCFMRMPKHRKAYFCARNKRQGTVIDFFGIQFAIFGCLVPVETKTQLVKRCNILETALQVMIFAAVVAVLLLISSSLIADDARKLKDFPSLFGSLADKLSAAAVC